MRKMPALAYAELAARLAMPPHSREWLEMEIFDAQAESAGADNPLARIFLRGSESLLCDEVVDQCIELREIITACRIGAAAVSIRMKSPSEAPPQPAQFRRRQSRIIQPRANPIEIFFNVEPLSPRNLDLANRRRLRQSVKLMRTFHAGGGDAGRRCGATKIGERDADVFTLRQAIGLLGDRGDVSKNVGEIDHEIAPSKHFELAARVVRMNLPLGRG
jgi:hypothetical protein